MLGVEGSPLSWWMRSRCSRWGWCLHHCHCRCGSRICQRRWWGAGADGCIIDTDWLLLSWSCQHKEQGGGGGCVIDTGGGGQVVVEVVVMVVVVPLTQVGGG